MATTSGGYDGDRTMSSPYAQSNWMLNAIAYAKQMVGGTYVLGAQNAGSRTFDCSGLVQAAYTSAGAMLPRLARDQYSATARVNAAQAQAGDLVFFKDTTGANKGVTHVGIYIGNGQMINAVSEGKGIQVQSINTPYWQSHLAGFGRAVQGVNSPKTAQIAQPKVNAGQPVGSPATDAGLAAYNAMLNKAAAQQARLIDAQINQIDAQIQNATDTLAQTKLRDERSWLLDQRTQYINLASNLMNTAASLSGPRDWVKYANYMSQGGSLFGSLFGNTPNAAFGAPSGTSAPNTVGNLMQQLGINAGNVPTNGALGGQIPQSLQSILNGYAQPAAQTAGASAAQGPQPLTYQVKAGDTLTKIAAQNGTTVQALAGANGIKNVNQISTGTTLTIPGKTQPGTGTMGAPATGGAAPTPGTGTMGSALVPLPHQINPAVWDSLSPTAKQMVLGAAEGGLTPSGYISGDDYLDQINKARPKGQATVGGTAWSPLASAFA